jgi:sigma-B regulation protein RsbU (phosphoserine phosphatase)
VKVNTSVYKDAKISEVFATLSVITYNSVSRILRYSGAGDLPIIYRNAKTKTAHQISSRGMLLGFAAEGFFEDESIQFETGDIAVLLTDGLIESRNAVGVPLGTDNLVKLVASIPSAVDPLEWLQKSLTAYTDGKFEDDISMIVIMAE